MPRDPQRGEDVLGWARQISRVVRALYPRPGPDIAPRLNSGGVVYELVRRRANRSTASTTKGRPYQVTGLKPVPATEDDPTPPPRLQVEIDSWLVKSVKMDDKVTVAGLGPDAAFDFDVGDSGYFYVWIVAEITDGAATSVYIDYGQETDLWPDYPDPVELGDADTDGFEPQVKAFRLLAYVQPQDTAYPDREQIVKDDVPYQIFQCVDSNLQLCEGCFNGVTRLLFDRGFAPGPA